MGGPSWRPLSVKPISLAGPRRTHEAHLSTKCSQACQETRLSQSYEHARRSRRVALASPQGPRSPLSVIGRLSNRRDFARLKAEGVRRGRGPLRLLIRGDDYESTRFAYAIPRSVGNAVVRNRTKRRVREVLRELDREHGLASGDCLIRVSSSIEHWSHERLRTTMADLMPAHADFDQHSRLDQRRT